MNKFNHPHGNLRSKLLKFFKNFLTYSITFFVRFFCRLDKNEEVIISSAVYCPWKDDDNFLNFYQKIENLTLLDLPRAYTLWNLSNNLKNYNADILDLGCLQGGSGFLMSKQNSKGKTLMFDTFDSFNKNDGLHTKKTFLFKDIASVEKNIKKYNLQDTHVYKLRFPNNLKVKINRVKLCHFDVNTYSETKNCFEFVNKKIVKGGVMVFDDYGIWGVDGIKKFILYVRKKYSKNYTFITNYMGQYILIKR
jgi:O-methyltransferase